ncbi:MAG: restriction endonuclease subunit S, partial [Nitrososphaerota archaeon]|nr:restriction endonuclease subunit S [Nitrososphaerota archaeon]
SDDNSYYAGLPNGWIWTTLGVYLDVRDGTHDTPKYVENGVPLITSKNLCNGNIDFNNVKLISFHDHEAISLRSRVDKNDVLFAMIGSIGNPVLVKEHTVFSIKNVALFKKIFESTNMSYVLHYLKYVQDKMKIGAKGGLQPFVPLNMLRDYPISIPPLAEQHRIVVAIEEAFEQLDSICVSLA